MSMFEKLEDLESRYEELSAVISAPGASYHSSEYRQALKEHGRLGRIVEVYREYKRTLERLEEARSLVEEEEDRELIALAREEMEELRQRQEGLLSRIKQELIAAESDIEDPDRLIMEIRSGTGGEEASLFVADLFRMYCRYGERNHWKIEVIDSSPTELDGFKEIIFSIKGRDAYLKLQYESGGHRVQRVPKTESQGRIHTSAVTVAVLPEVEEVEVELNPADIRFETFRASGPGGQKVNKTSSAVRLTHIPTGIVVSIQDEKSQHKNRAKAERILRSRIYMKKKEEQEARRGALRKSQIGSGDRSERVRTYNFPQNRVTDHRINLSVYDLENFMMGDLDSILVPLQEHFQALKLQEIFKGGALD